MSGVAPDTDEARAIRFALRNPTGQYRVIESEPLAALERLIARAEAAEVRAEQLEAEHAAEYDTLMNAATAKLSEVLADRDRLAARAEQLEAALQIVTDELPLVTRGEVGGQYNIWLSNEELATINAARAAVAGDPREPRP